ncbi:MAG TPA: hypothetical protein VGN65_03515, partial [Casimicrobiaceae bacterium]
DFENDNNGWMIAASPGTSVDHLPFGWNDSSGSMGLSADIINGNASEVTVLQCANDPPGVLDASIEVLQQSAPDAGLFSVNLWAFSTQDCDFSGFLSMNPLAPAPSTPLSSWTQFLLSGFVMPAGSASVMLEILVSTGSNTNARYAIDYVNVSADVIFRSNFE